MSNLLSCFPLLVRPRNTYAAVQCSSLQRKQGVASEAVAVLLSVGLLDFSLKEVCLHNVKYIYIYRHKCWIAWPGWHLNAQKLSATSVFCSTVTFGSSVCYSISRLPHDKGNAEQLSFVNIYGHNYFVLHVIQTASKSIKITECFFEGTYNGLVSKNLDTKMCLNV